MTKNESKVKILPKDVANKIAAGEVVERPASVIKELIENSIDAGSSEIKVIVKAGGIGELSVYDNGQGMAKQDILLTPTRFATSKITDEKNLDKVSTLGFRGEALSSIAAVSKLSVSSAIKDDKGYRVEVEGGKIEKKGEIVMDRGTIVKVRDLFYNVPARRKFLKTKIGETRAIVDIVKRYAVSYPGIDFELIVDGKKVLDVKAVKAGKFPQRVKEVLNDPWAENGVEVFSSADLVISGVVASINDVRKGRPTQWFFVNSRPVDDSRVKFVVSEAYESIAKRGKPGFVLFASVPYEQVDVNVHPRKSEVKFSDPRGVYKEVYTAVKKVFTDEKDKRFLRKESTTASSDRRGAGVVKERTAKYGDVSEALAFTKALLKPGDPSGERGEQVDFGGVPADSWEWNKGYPIVQLADSYLVTQDSAGIVVIDQHAAAERILYEKLLKGFRKGKVIKQSLVVPIDVDVDETDLTQNWEERFKKLGILAEKFGKGMVRIRAVPAGIDPGEVKALFLDLLENTDTASGLDEQRRDIAARIACHHAIKFGDKLSKKDISNLVSNLAKCKNPFSCPHGRPTMYRIEFSKLEKLFGRT